MISLLVYSSLQQHWFDMSIYSSPTSLEAYATNMAFIIKQQQTSNRSSWSTFNQQISKSDPEKTLVGYLPIIQTPAHDIETLNTAVEQICCRNIFGLFDVWIKAGILGPNSAERAMSGTAYARATRVPVSFSGPH